MEILNEIIIYTVPYWTPAPILGCILGILLLLLFADIKRIGRTLVIFFFSITCLFLTFYNYSFGRERQVTYEVVFHDLVNINELLDQYEIIDIEGHIVTIKERERD